MRGDGDGWTYGPDGSRHWGLYGAAGLLLRAPLPNGRPAVLLQHRAIWSHHGGTWALPGGARDSHESAIHAAVREAEEEAGIGYEAIRVRGERVTAEIPGWTYTTVVADIHETVTTRKNPESRELRWVPEDEVGKRKLHPAFKESWPQLQTVPMRLADLDLDIEDPLPLTVALPDAGFAWLSP